MPNRTLPPVRTDQEERRVRDGGSCNVEAEPDAVRVLVQLFQAMPESHCSIGVPLEVGKDDFRDLVLANLDGRVVRMPRHSGENFASGLSPGDAGGVDVPCL